MEENIDDTITKNLEKFGKNSEIWSYCILEKIDRETQERTTMEHNEIFKMEKRDNGKYFFKEEFKLMKASHMFTMRCLLCDHKENYYISSPSCSKMIEHLHQMHPEYFGKNEPIRRKSYCNYSNCKDIHIKNLHILLTCFLIDSFSSFHVIDNPFFQKFINNLNSSYIAPSRTTISDKISDDLYNKIIILIKQELESVKSVSITLDLWTSNYTRNKYISFTCHYSKNEELKSRVLRLHYVEESADSGFITKFINETIEEFGLERLKPMQIVTDHAPDVLKAVEDSGNKSFGCVAHLINLVFNNVLDSNRDFNYISKKMIKISNSIKNSSLLLSAWNCSQKETMGMTLSPLVNVENRWFSQIPVMKGIATNVDISNGVLEANSKNINDRELREAYLEDYIITEFDKKMCDFYVKIFENLYNLLLKLISDEINTCSFVIPIYNEFVAILKNILHDLENTNETVSSFDENSDFESNVYEYSIISFLNGDTIVEQFDYGSSGLRRNELQIEKRRISVDMKESKKEFIEDLLQSIDYYYKEKYTVIYDEMTIMSCFINPFFKMEFFDEKQIEITKRNLAQMKSVFDEQIRPAQQVFSLGRINNKQIIRKDEFDLYIEEGTLENRDLSFQTITQYWENRKEMWPFLYSVAQKFSPCLASSASSERTFSTAGDYYSKKRTRMLPSHLERIVIIKNFLENDGEMQLLENNE